MTEQNSNSKLTLINATLVMLVIYNILYWGSKFKWFLEPFYLAITKHWKLIMFFEFLAVASVAVDVIIRFDTFPKESRKQRLIFTALIGFLFMLRFLFGVIELYMRGEVR